MTVTPDDLARTLVRRNAERLAEWQRRADELRPRVLAAVVALQKEGACKRAWLIGSLAWGRFGPRSDVDLVLEGLTADVAGRLWDELDVPVDVIRVERISPEFRARVLAQGLLLGVS